MEGRFRNHSDAGWIDRTSHGMLLTLLLELVVLVVHPRPASMQIPHILWLTLYPIFNAT